MTKQEYYNAIKAMVPSCGEMSFSCRAELAQLMRKTGEIATPATNNELGAIINYLNNRCMDVDLWGDNPGFMRYKDAVLCINYEHTGWILLERRPEEQLWDLWDRLENLVDDEQLNQDMSTAYSSK